MYGFRALLLTAVCGLALAVSGTAGLAQSPITGFSLTAGLGLPAVDVGKLTSQYVAPASERKANLVRAGSSGARYAAGRLIVKFRQAGDARAAASPAPRSSRPQYADFDIVAIDPAEDAEAAAAAYRARPDVEYAQPEYLMRKRFVPNDPLYRELQWNMPMVNAERAWDIQPQAGSSIVVAVLDTGVAYAAATIRANIAGFSDDAGARYPALPNVTIPYSAASQLGPSSRFVAPRDFIWNTTTPLDFDGHGTHVSGTIGQTTNDGVGVAGLAYNVKIMPVKVICSVWDVLFGIPESSCGTDSQVAQGIRYAADNGARVINMSIGRSGPPAPAVEDAMRYAVSRGVFIAVAAGNDGDAGNPVEVIAEIAGRLEGAVTVAALDVFRGRTVYSSFGPWVELAAPGGGGGSADSGYVWQQTFDFNETDTYNLPVSRYRAPRFDVHAYVGYAGTSMASPHVAGAAAMLMQQGITSPAAIEAALERTAFDLGSPGRDDFYGFGLIDARNGLRGLGLAR